MDFPNTAEINPVIQFVGIVMAVSLMATVGYGASQRPRVPFPAILVLAGILAAHLAPFGPDLARTESLISAKQVAG